MDLNSTEESYRPPSHTYTLKMMSQIKTAIHTSYVRACVAVYQRHGAEMEESVRDEIWEEMLFDMSNGPQVVSIPTIGSTAGSDAEEDTKLSPQQRLEKQSRTLTAKVDTIRARQGTAKQTTKQKEKDPEDLAKSVAKLAEVDAKLLKLTEKHPKKHMEKWTPTWTKHFKAANGKDDEQAAFQEYINAMTEAEFKKSSYAEHAVAYVARVPKAAAPKAAAPKAPAAAAAAAASAAPAPKKNMEKWTPTWAKNFKTELSKVEQVAFQEYVNAMPEVEYKKLSYAKHAEAYVKHVAASAASASEDEDVVPVSYDGEDFIVGSLTRSVYRVTEQGDVPVEDMDTAIAVLKKYEQLMGLE